MRSIFGFLWVGVLVCVLVVAGTTLLSRYGCNVPVVRTLVSNTCPIGEPFGEIRKISELSTAVSTNQVIIEQEDAGIQGVLPDFLTSQSVLLIVVGDVRAGIDLEELEERDIRVSGDDVVPVNLPEAKILSVSLDENRTRVYDSDNGILRVLDNDNDLVQEARRRAVEEIEATALRNEIIEKANKNAEESIRVLLENAGYKEIRFE